MRSRRSGQGTFSRRPPRLAAVAVAVLAVGMLGASCDSGSSKSAKSTKPAKTASPKPSATGYGTATQAATPTGAEAGVAQYLKSQGIEYAGDCATAQLPRDEGKWCSTLLEGANSNDKRVYGIGPVGEKPTKVITVTRHGSAQLTPGFEVGVADGNVGAPRQLTSEELLANLFITGNLILDQQAGIGAGLADLPGGAPSTSETGTGGGGGTGTPAPEVTEPPNPNAAYPPNGDIVVVDPNVVVGGKVTFRGSGCASSEPLQVLFDGKQIGTITADAEGAFAGEISIPPGAAPGAHAVTVRGAVCVLNTTVNVLGANLAFTGSSSHTGTYVLGSIAAIVLGAVLIVGSRRRRRGIRGRRLPPPSTA